MFRTTAKKQIYELYLWKWQIVSETHALDITNIWHHQQCQKIKGTSSWSLVQQYTAAQRYFNISVFPSYSAWSNKPLAFSQNIA